MSKPIAELYLKASMEILERDMGSMTPDRILSITTKLKNDMLELMEGEAAIQGYVKHKVDVGKGLVEKPDAVSREEFRKFKKLTTALLMQIKYDRNFEEVGDMLNQLSRTCDD
jgi:hypothetical protein